MRAERGKLIVSGQHCLRIVKRVQRIERSIELAGRSGSSSRSSSSGRRRVILIVGNSGRSSGGY